MERVFPKINEKFVTEEKKGEESYAYRLMEFMSEKTNLPFKIFIFTDGSKLFSCAKVKDIECLLVSENVYSKEVETLKIPHIVILSESGENLNKALHHINKYQSCENILHEVLEYYTNQSENVPAALRAGLNKMKMIGIYACRKMFTNHILINPWTNACKKLQNSLFKF